MRSCANTGAGFCSVVRGKRPTGAFSDPSNPYRPDMNPIETAFSKLKAHLRRIGARSFTGCSKPSAKYAISILRKNAGTTFVKPGMILCILEVL